MATRETYDRNGNVILTETIPDKPRQTHLHPWDVKQLLTADEWLALSASNDAIVRALLNELGFIVDTVDIQGEKLQQGLGYLVSVGILTSERVAEISQGLEN
jgi:hypothetical protein